MRLVLQASVALVLALGVLNRVLNKMATVPMGNYLFFLAQIQTFGYVIFYGAILASRRRSAQAHQRTDTPRPYLQVSLNLSGTVVVYSHFQCRAGLVTDEMLAAPDKRKFVLIGLLEATAQLISMVCVSKLPGQCPLSLHMNNTSETGQTKSSHACFCTGVVLPLLQQTTLLWQVALVGL